jgi:hypothetical protein
MFARLYKIVHIPSSSVYLRSRIRRPSRERWERRERRKCRERWKGREWRETRDMPCPSSVARRGYWSSRLTRRGPHDDLGRCQFGRMSFLGSRRKDRDVARSGNGSCPSTLDVEFFRQERWHGSECGLGCASRRGTFRYPASPRMNRTVATGRRQTGSRSVRLDGSFGPRPLGGSFGRRRCLPRSTPYR